MRKAVLLVTMPVVLLGLFGRASAGAPTDTVRKWMVAPRNLASFATMYP